MEPPLDTNELLVRSTEGDLEAFRRLVEYYQGYAYALAVRLLHNEDDAREVVQDSFIRVWKNLSRYDPRSRFTTWLYRIVTNLSYDLIRARTRRGRVILPEHEGLPESVPGGIGEPEQEMINRSVIREIEALTSDLPPRQRIVFVLRDLHDLSIREVTEITGIPAHSVKTNLYLARRKIREKLEKSEESGKSDKREKKLDEMQVR